MSKEDEWRKEIKLLLTKNFVIDANGHIIYFPEHYYELGFPTEFVDQFIKNHESDDSIIGTIYKNDGSKKGIAYGVWNLDFLYGLVGLFNLHYAGVTSRGENAKECVRVLKEYMKN